MKISTDFNTSETTPSRRPIPPGCFFSPFATTHDDFEIGGIEIHEHGTPASIVGKGIGTTGHFPPADHHREFGPEPIYIPGSGHHGGYNWVLHSVFDSEDDINTYRSAPLHLEFVEYCDPYTEDFIVSYYQAP